MSEEKNTIDKIIINLGSTPIKAEKVNEIVQDLVNRGYKKENIHIVKEENNNIKKVPNSFMVGLNIEDDKEQNYNMLIDTSLSEAKDISEAISVCKKSEEDGIPYGKMWTTPKKLLPLQGIRDTCGSGLYMTFEEMLDSISKFGYLPEAPILIVEYQGKKYIIEGHHRNFDLHNLENLLYHMKFVQVINRMTLKNEREQKTLHQDLMLNIYMIMRHSLIKMEKLFLIMKFILEFMMNLPKKN